MVKNLSSRELIKILEADGWRFFRARGDHHYFKHPTKSGKITVTHPVKTLSTALINEILKQAGLK